MSVQKTKTVAFGGTMTHENLKFIYLGYSVLCLKNKYLDDKTLRFQKRTKRAEGL